MSGAREMRVYGVLVPTEALDAVRAWMQAKSELFTASEVTVQMIAAGVPRHLATMRRNGEPVAYRAADRLIQAERKAGRIAYTSGFWFRKVQP